MVPVLGKLACLQPRKTDQSECVNTRSGVSNQRKAANARASKLVAYAFHVIACAGVNLDDVALLDKPRH
jgi:hypothetical protein